MQPADASGQAGTAQRCGRKVALKEAWHTERHEQQWWAARRWVPDDGRGGNAAVQIPRRLWAAVAEHKTQIMQPLAESCNIGDYAAREFQSKRLLHIDQMLMAKPRK
eukprot:14028905-Alexandrium_andersonii.AAC.1